MMDKLSPFIRYVDGRVVPIRKDELAKCRKSAVLRVPEVPDGLEFQVALDELSTSGSTDALRTLLARNAGVDPNTLKFVSKPWSIDNIDEAQLTYIGKLDTVDENVEAAVTYVPPKDVEIDIVANTKSRKPFQYQPLQVSPPQIRLLKLNQTQFPGHFDRLHIQHFSIDKAPPYSCLSYVWGNPERFIPVNIDGKFTMITQNLYHALRMSYDRYPDMYLWCDGLCINQEDLDERAQQVQLMGSIYSNAEKTLAFPGHYRYAMNNEFEDSKAVQDIQLSASKPEPENDKDDNEDTSEKTGSEADGQNDEMGEQVTPLEAARPALSLMNYITRIWSLSSNLSAAEIWKQHKVPDAEDDTWHRLYDYLRQDWTYRQWVLQEAVLSKKLVIFYGDAVVSLDATIEFFEAARRNVPPKQLRHGVLADLYNKILWTNPITIFASLRELTTKDEFEVSATIASDQLATRTPDLLTLLSDCRRHLVTDPRDKVYALLALTEDPVAKSIIPSYHAQNSVNRTYIEVAKRFVLDGKLLRLLEHGGIGEMNLPSWVPDWTKRTRSQLKTHLYKTASHSKHSGILLEHNDHVKVRAAKVGKIAHMAPGWRFYDHHIHDTANFFDPIHPTKSNSGEEITFPPFRDEDVRCLLWQMAEKFVGDPEVYNFDIYTEEMDEAIARTLCADVDWSGTRINSSEATHKSFIRAFQAFRSFYVRGPDEDGSHLNSDSDVYYHISGIFHWILECSEDEAEEMMHKLWPFVMAFQDASRGRRFAILTNGLIALVPWDSQKEDTICIFDGGRVPFVIRNSGDEGCFQVVGDAYVHGLMGGELFNGEGSTKVEDPTTENPATVRSFTLKHEHLPEIRWNDIEIC